MAAFRGCASSTDPQERRDAAGALPSLARMFPEEAISLVTLLTGDEATEVRSSAEHARFMIGEAAVAGAQLAGDQSKE